MESSRDSSVWRDLAVTFGGGLALGAVGMKLTQTALRPLEASPRPEPETGEFAGRLRSVERRLERMEHSPAPAHPVTTPSQPAPASIDQKVLEAVIGAVEARLHEHSGQMDRRLADIEARLAVTLSAQQQDRHASQHLREEAAAVRSAMASDMRQMRESVVKALTGQAATNEQRFAGLRQEIEQSVEARVVTAAAAAVESDLRQMHESVSRTIAGQAATNEQRFAGVRQEIEQSVEARVVTAAAAAVAEQMDRQLAPLRAEVEQKEKELVELRARLADSERSVLDIVLAIGDVCRQAADRIGGPREPRPAPPPAPIAPVAELRPKLEAVAPASAPGIAEPVGMAPSGPPPNAANLPLPLAGDEPALAPALPGFLHEGNHHAGWRIPLVSSFLVCTGYLFLMHYLALPLQ